MENFSMTFAENRTYGVPEFAGTEVNRHSSKLKGLSGYLQNYHDTMAEDKTQQKYHWHITIIVSALLRRFRLPQLSQIQP